MKIKFVVDDLADFLAVQPSRVATLGERCEHFVAKEFCQVDHFRLLVNGEKSTPKDDEFNAGD
jgi:hypothetical protein